MVGDVSVQTGKWNSGMTEGIRWAVSSFSLFKSPSSDRLEPVLLQRELEKMGSRLIEILVEFLALRCNPRPAGRLV